MSRARVAVYLSGRGSNYAALAAAAAAPDFPAEIVAVLADSDAEGLRRVPHIPGHAVERRAHASRAAFEDALDAVTRAAGADLICLAGFMRILSPAFVQRREGRILNIHPSLLPAFRGLDTHARALAAGVKLHGATVHLVTAELDDGPILAQGAIPVLPGDTAETLAARVLRVEHRLYPAALARFVRGESPAAADTMLFNPPID